MNTKTIIRPRAGEQEVKDAAAAYEEVDAELDVVESDISDKQNEIADKQAEIDELTKEIAQLRGNEKALQAKLDELYKVYEIESENEEMGYSITQYSKYSRDHHDSLYG